MQFDFGENWSAFSKSALNGKRASQAFDDLKALTEDLDLRQKTFLDIGFGQGLALLNAARMGARVTGCDINPKCGEALELTRSTIPEFRDLDAKVVIGSILEDQVVSKLLEVGTSSRDGFDIVHSWGVLHHTGNLKRAIANAASLVGRDGYFIIALYNRHWSSSLWRVIKWAYCVTPVFLRKLWIWGMYPPIWLAKLLVTGRNPTKKQRGMDFFYDVIDWVGGYPYEYASIDEVHALVEPLGFRRVRVVPAEVPTGCNEFVYRRDAR